MGDMRGIGVGILEGKLNNGIKSVSNAIESIKDIKSCNEITKELMEGISY